MTIKRFSRWAVLAMLAVPVAVAAGKDRPSAVDAELAVYAHYHHLNETEIDLGKLAQKTSHRPAVKAYGQMLVKDHAAGDKSLVALARKNHVIIPLDVPANDVEATEASDERALIAKLRTLQGAEFDQQFLAMMVAGHDRELSRIDLNITRVTNSDLVKLLEATKPTLLHHADEARALEKSAPQASR